MMKKFILAFVAVIGLSISASARDTYSRNLNDLPKGAQTTISQNFKAKVNIIKIDKELGRIAEYEVVLTDGSEITFDKDGNWKEVEVGKSKSVPAGFVPSAISNYVKNNQKGKKIVGIEKKRGGYDVELNDGLEMKFDSTGKFIRFDD